MRQIQMNGEPQAAKVDEHDQFPRLGISLEGIRAFIVDTCGGLEALQGASTEDVCERFVKPATSHTRESYCNTFADSQFVGEANAFVSHAWRQPFLDTVGALEAWAAEHGRTDDEHHGTDAAEPHRTAVIAPDSEHSAEAVTVSKRPAGAGSARSGAATTFFWFDVFSNGQWKTAVRAFEWWTTVFRENIARIGRTLLVLEYRDPKPLTRAWCLWEIVSSIHTRAELVVAMSTAQQREFEAELVHRFDEIVKRVCSVDVERAEALRPEDRECIFQAVRASIGFEAVNAQVAECIRNWMAGAGMKALERIADAEQRALSALQTQYASLLYAQGRYDEAEPLLLDALEVRRRILGPQHVDTLACMDQYCLLLEAKGRYDRADSAFREVLAVHRAALGETHSSTVRVLHNYGSLLARQGRGADAEPIFRQALQHNKDALGDTHSATLSCKNNLAVVLNGRGKLHEATRLLKDVLRIRLRHLGDTHPDTLTAMSNYATMLMAAGQYRKAYRLYGRAQQISARVLGSTHPSTLRRLSNCALALEKLGKLSRAETVAKQAMQAFQDSQGPGHRDTLDSMEVLASILRRKGNVPEAERVLRQVVQTRVQVLGEGHPDTFRSKVRLAEVQLETGKHEEAEALLARASRGLRAVLQDAHPVTVAAVDLYARLLQDRGELDAAERLSREVAGCRAKLLGPKHAHSIACRIDLAHVLHKQSRDDEARDILLDVLSIFGVDDAAMLEPPASEDAAVSFWPALQVLRDVLISRGSTSERATADKIGEKLDDRARNRILPPHPHPTVMLADRAQQLPGALAVCNTCSRPALAAAHWCRRCNLFFCTACFARFQTQHDGRQSRRASSAGSSRSLTVPIAKAQQVGDDPANLSQDRVAASEPD